MTQEELLNIYHQIYRHDVLTMKRDGTEHHHLDLIIEVADFANRIATQPESKATQEMARDVLEFLGRIHHQMSQQLEQEKWPHLCDCMRDIIDQRVKRLEQYVDELSDDDTEEGQAVWTVYERWLLYQYRMNQRS